MSKAIGIHIGPTNSVVAFKDATVRVLPTGQNNEKICRSCVALDKSGNFVVGNESYKNWKRYTPNIVVSVKYLMGVPYLDPKVQMIKRDKNTYPFGISKQRGADDAVAIIMNGKEFTPEEICAQILHKLKEDASVQLGDKVTHAVITVPRYFNEKQRNSTRQAAELAGLKVLQLIEEPIAAAISYGIFDMLVDVNKTTLIYDLDDDTFDISILVPSLGCFLDTDLGDNQWLGKNKIYRAVSEHVIREVEQIHNVDIHELIGAMDAKKKAAFQGEFKNEVENVTKELSQHESATISVFDYLETANGTPIDIEITLTREKFESIIRPVVQRTIDLIDKLLTETTFDTSHIDNVLLIGSASCIPLVHKMLTNKFGKDKIRSSKEPLFALAEGAAILANAVMKGTK